MKLPLVLVVAGCFFAAVASAQETAIRAGKLIDPDSGTVLSDQIILIHDSKIEKVGKGLAIPPNAEVVDLSKMTVLPGLIDCHTHLADGARTGDPIAQFKKTAAQIALESVPNARAMLESGFTTVRDVGTYRALGDIALRDAINRGDIVGPRMFVAGAYVTISGDAGALTGLAPDIQLPWDLHYGEANSPWEVRKVVRQLAHDGVDHIKVLSSGAVLTHGSNPEVRKEFHRRKRPCKLPSTRQVISGSGSKRTPALWKESRMPRVRGVASVEHATMIDDEGIALAKQHGAYLDMDIYDEECIGGGRKKIRYPAGFSGTRCRDLDRIQRNKHSQDGNVRSENLEPEPTPVVCEYGISGKQFAFMVKYGMTPMQAMVKPRPATPPTCSVTRLRSVPSSPASPQTSSPSLAIRWPISGSWKMSRS